MGGDLPASPDGKAPTFLVAAMKDPEGGNLDRVQVIKGWLDRPRQDLREGLRREVVWSDRVPRMPTASCRRSATRST